MYLDSVFHNYNYNVHFIQCDEDFFTTLLTEKNSKLKKGHDCAKKIKWNSGLLALSNRFFFS